MVYYITIYLRTKVPYVATPKERFSVIFKNINITPETVVYDLGCGKGDFLFAAEKFNPKKLIGFELSPVHVLWGKIKAKILKSKAKIFYQDFFRADVAEADIIYLFLVKAVLPGVWRKLSKEAKKGVIIVTLSAFIPCVNYKKMVEASPGKKMVLKFIYTNCNLLIRWNFNLNRTENFL